GVELSEESLRLRDRLEAVFRKSGYQPPLLGEVIGSSDANPEETRRVLFWMIREKILVKVSDELVYHREVLEEIKSRIRSGLAPGSKFGVAEFKQLFDLTRKHAIPLLEYLDRERFTRRQGNDRILL
ncbi:MAG: SelB C-terminal domain-containing protein, partial [Acidobacteria bacterium]|nr:SelB C-terminal domain-containing protein [Acidobacteriota bacterium]